MNINVPIENPELVMKIHNYINSQAVIKMYGKELREKIISARERGITVSEICRVNGVSPRMVFDVSRLYRETGSVAARKGNGRKPKLNKEDLRNLETLLAQRPDITLEEMREELKLPISVSNLSRIVRQKLGYTYKKIWCTPLNRTDPSFKSNESSGWIRFLEYPHPV